MSPAADLAASTIVAILLFLSFPCLLVLAAAGDIKRYRIPNTLNIALACLYLPTALLAGSTWGTIGWHVAAGGAVLVVGIVLFALNWLGGGDAKLLAAAACWTGFAGLPGFLIFTALAGGVLALVLLAVRRLLRGRIDDDSSLARLLGQTRDVPYGIAIAVGGLAMMPKLDIVRTLFTA